MNTTKKEALKIVGVSVRTINTHDKAPIDIPKLWQEFAQNNPASQLPNRLSDDVYCVYCEYEGDHTAPYTTLIGYSVPTDFEVPAGFKSVEIAPSNYEVVTAEGNLSGGAIVEAWNKIWGSSFDRTYKADFEIHGVDAKDLTNGKLDIFVGVN